MDVGAISIGNHQGPVVMKEAPVGKVDGNVSTAFTKGHCILMYILLPSLYSSIHSSNIFLLLLLYIFSIYIDGEFVYVINM